mmetsp:Transcript_27470/g.64395  ORF Transcript_27470/g.64395 Transcript_27470/m.64395 type:complete len:238 (-) Transcript_27470:1103-1816(-)
MSRSAISSAEMGSNDLVLMMGRFDPCPSFLALPTYTRTSPSSNSCRSLFCSRSFRVEPCVFHSIQSFSRVEASSNPEATSRSRAFGSENSSPFWTLMSTLRGTMGLVSAVRSVSCDGDRVDREAGKQVVTLEPSSPLWILRPEPRRRRRRNATGEGCKFFFVRCWPTNISIGVSLFAAWRSLLDADVDGRLSMLISPLLLLVAVQSSNVGSLLLPPLETDQRPSRTYGEDRGKSHRS